MSASQARLDNVASHYDVNGYSTACGQVMHYPRKPGDAPARSYVDHGRCTNVETKVGCVACKTWLARYREAFPRGEHQPEFWEIAAQKQKARDDAEAERDSRREAWEAAEYQRSLPYQPRFRASRLHI